MKISLSSAIILLLAVSIAAGILLYPTSVSCTSILKDNYLKATDQAEEPNIHCSEPGEAPDVNIGPLGSSLGTSIDAQKSDLPIDDNREIRMARSRYMQLLFFYLRNFSRGPFQGR